MATINDILKVLPPGWHDKVIILDDGNGWTNVSVDIKKSIDRNCIVIKPDCNHPFDND